MKKFFSLIILTLVFAGVGLAQASVEPTEADKQANFDAAGLIKRGSPLSANVKKVSLAKAMKNPQKYSGQTVLVEGVIVRSCKNKGCWMELAPDAKSKSVRINMKNHAFFIPLSSAGFKARAEGVFSIKTLSKEHVDHLINDDGAKFDKRNPDGTVTEISFEATGVELRKS
jgi:hypothetical protein